MLTAADLALRGINKKTAFRLFFKLFRYYSRPNAANASTGAFFFQNFKAAKLSCAHHMRTTTELARKDFTVLINNRVDTGFFRVLSAKFRKRTKFKGFVAIHNFANDWQVLGDCLVYHIC